MTREQMIDKAVRRVFMRRRMKRPTQCLAAIANRVKAHQSFHAGVPSRQGWTVWDPPSAPQKWYKPPGQSPQRYLIRELERLTVSEFAFQGYEHMPGRVRAEFSRITDEQAHA